MNTATNLTETANAKNKGGFTLIELLVVVAIVAVVAMLAVNKYGDLGKNARKNANIANLARIANGIETYIAACDTDSLTPSFNKLDNFIRYSDAEGTEGDTSDLDKAPAMLSSPSPTNVGLSSNLTSATTMYGIDFSPILGTYYLTAAESAALRDIGIQYLFCAADGGRMDTGDDGAWAQGILGNPDKTCVQAKSVTNKIAVAVVNPMSVYTGGSSILPAGTEIYRACGQDVVFGYSGRAAKIVVNGDTDHAYTSNEDVFSALKSGDGVLLAFGIGDNCALVGGNLAGFDSAPVSPVMEKYEYRRYITLIRLKSNGRTATAEYAGVMDPNGNVLGQLR